MEICTGIVSSIVTKAGEYMLSPIKNHVKYISNHEKNVQILKDRADRLKDARERVLHSVDAAKRNGEEIEHDVDKWLSTVDKKIREGVEKVLQDEEKAKKNCFIGLCPNPWNRYRHSLRAEEESKAVAELLERGKFESVSYRSAPQVDSVMAPVKYFEEFESRTLVLNGIMEALKEDGVSVIGVCGMGGIGKTTLVKQVARKVKGELFDSVVIATVTQTLDVKDIQNQIAYFLGLKFEEPNMVGRAQRLRERLSKENKILVVLDDIWAKLDIGEIGISFGDEHKGCKILLTSREFNVLSNGMDTQKIFAVGILNDKEAWDLFKKMAGDCVETSSLQPIAMEVGKKCAGLPIAIATVASALRNKSEFEWNNALRELKTPSSSSFTGITEAYSAIEWSYNYLKSEEDKMTFLLCSLIGHNGSVEDLVRYTLGLRLFGGVNSMKDSRNKVLTVVANLKASCLLLDSYNDERFDIHDVVWDVALTIASRDGHMLVLRDHVPKEWFDKEKMHNWRVISLRSPRIMDELPKEMECSGLSFFHMAHNVSVKIPSCFFRQTKSLKVLDFSRMQFLSLRESISHLTDLRMLCLRNCALEDITIIGELKNLEILSLADSDIKALPLEIAQLSRLKSLDLSGCRKLKVIPPNVLSSLSKLEELYMERSFAEWEDGGVVGNERRNASLDELNDLPRLTTLYARIPNAEMIPKHRFVETLDRYRIIVGDDEGRYWYENHEFSRTLTFKLHKNMYLDNGVKMLLKKTEDLYLEGLEGIKNVLVELNNGEGFPYLKRLNVKNGMHVQYITMEKIEFSELRSITLNDLPELISFCSQDERCSTSSEPLPLFNKKFVFPSLESLELSFINAKSIWNNQTCDWVSNLTRLVIEDCPNLEHLLSPSMARNLMHLQQFEIVNCESLREIIFTEEIEEEKKDVICFPRLNSLHIRGLQNLVIFCSGNYNIEFPLLKGMWIYKCPNLKEFISQTSDQSGKHALFNEKAALPSLETMTISGLRNVKMIFHNELLAPGSFCKLEKLQVKDCDSLEQIFELGRLNTKELHAVDSQRRPKLKHVWNKDPQEIPTFQNLREVHVSFCNSLKNVFPASIAKDLPKLEDLSIRLCGVEEIVSVGEGVEQPVRFKFPQVSSLQLSNLKKLKCFYEGQHTIVWPKLKKLTTDYSTLPKILGLECLGIQETNGNNQPESTVGQSVSLVKEVIPKLEELGLHNLGDVDQLPPDMFRSIKVFKVFSSHGGSSIFPFLQRLYNLKSLEFFRFDFKDEVPCKADAGTLTRIKNLVLNSSENLKHIWKKDSELDLILSNLQTLQVLGCYDLVNIEPLSLSFQNLTTLEVSYCKMMTYLVTPSVVQNLVQLTTLSVSHCSEMTEIVRNEGDGATYHQTLVVAKLKCLQLIDLVNLTSFCPGDYAFSFPYLEELLVYKCGRLKIFCQGVLSTPKLQCVKETDSNYDEGRWAGDLNTTIQQMYNEEVGSDGLAELKFSDTFPDLMEIWNRRNPCDILGFKGLREIEFCNCSSLKYIFTPSMLFSFNQLHWLKVKECNSMEEVINEEEEDATRHILTCRPLWSIEIESCPNLKRFYMGSRVLEFPELYRIEIADCPKMNGFCSSIEKGIGELDVQHNTAPFFSNQVLCPSLKRLRIAGTRDCTKIWPYQLAVNSCCKLEHLNIQNCDSLEEIIEPQGLVAYESDAVTATTKFAFPELTYLGLHKLPELKRFCSTMHTTQWPSLKRMEVIECPKVVIFAPCGETQTESRDGISNKNALFCVNEDTFPVLENLTLKQNDMMNGICLGQLSLECFKELKSLHLQCFPETSTTLPYRLIQSLPNLEKLIINNSFNSQIVQSEVLGNEERHTPTLSQIKELMLCELPELTLKTLEPYLQSFKNLTTLEVSNCNGFINLMACTTVKSLMVLEKISITDCEMMEEVIACEDEEIQGSIVFPKLKYLQLSCLPNLASFSLGDRMFEFPVLQTVIVKKCKNMRSFCQGDLSNVPRFHLTRDDKDGLWWEGDINATIKHMFDEENVQNSDASEVPHRLLELE